MLIIGKQVLFGLRYSFVCVSDDRLVGHMANVYTRYPLVRFLLPPLPIHAFIGPPTLAANGGQLLVCPCTFVPISATRFVRQTHPDVVH